MNTEVKFDRIFISPERAKQLLQGNKSNRSINNNLVKRYVEQMKKGQWQEDTAEPIKLAINGRLLDGQHRLNAVVIANKGFYFHIASNINESTFLVLDTGKKRSSADTLYTAGVTHSTSTAGGITTYLVLKQGKIINGRRKDLGISNDDVMDEYNSRPDFWNNIVTKSLGFYKDFNRTITPSSIIGWYALFYNISDKKADEFMYKLCTGVGFTTTNNPILQLKSILQKSKMNGGRKLSQYERTALMVKAWNAFIEGIDPKILTFDTKEKYPKLKTMVPVASN